MGQKLQHIDFGYFAANIAAVLEQVRDRNEPILVDRNGETYRVERLAPEDIWTGYDPAAVERALSTGRGVFAGTDPERFLRDVGEERAQGSNRSS